jgi:hypothetical protein
LFFPAAAASRRRGNDSGTTIKYLQKNNERRRGNRLRHHNQVPATYNGRRRGQRPGREEPHAYNGPLFMHYRGRSRATVLDRRGSRKRTSHLIYCILSNFLILRCF